MIHTKNLQFSYDDIDFEAVVTFNDSPFKDSRKLDTSVFYDVKLTKPEVLKCGGKVVQISGIMSLMLFSRQGIDANRHYIYIEDFDIKQEDENINVHPLAIEKVLYCYFNKEQIAHYKQKIEKFNELVDQKYAKVLVNIAEEKRALKSELKLGEIDSKVYQKRYKPIRLKKEEIEYKIFESKHRYERRYFECCELKARYRSFESQKMTKCDDLHSLCMLTSFLAKTQNIENNENQT